MSIFFIGLDQFKGDIYISRFEKHGLPEFFENWHTSKKKSEDINLVFRDPGTIFLALSFVLFCFASPLVLSAWFWSKSNI